jgi:hypothetical protein
MWEHESHWLCLSEAVLNSQLALKMMAAESKQEKRVSWLCQKHVHPSIYLETAPVSHRARLVREQA